MDLRSVKVMVSLLTAGWLTRHIVHKTGWISMEVDGRLGNEERKKPLMFCMDPDEGTETGI